MVNVEIGRRFFSGGDVGGEWWEWGSEPDPTRLIYPPAVKPVSALAGGNGTGRSRVARTSS